MERIDRGYAVIYIDRTGESLVVENENYKMDYTPNHIIDDYYKDSESGFKQWNFYLIISKELVQEKDISTIENCDKYTRKYVINDSDIDNFIEERFPILDDTNKGSIRLIKGENWIDSVHKAEEKEGEYTLYPSLYRNENIMYSLTQMDILRAKLIREPDHKALFYSHISNEMSIAEKKFKLFLEPTE